MDWATRESPKPPPPPPFQRNKWQPPNPNPNPTFDEKAFPVSSGPSLTKPTHSKQRGTTARKQVSVKTETSFPAGKTERKNCVHATRNKVRSSAQRDLLCMYRSHLCAFAV